MAQITLGPSEDQQPPSLVLVHSSPPAPVTTPSGLVLPASMLPSRSLIARPKPAWKFDDFAQLVPTTGFFPDYLKYAIQCTDAPPVYHIMSALGAVATMVAPFTDLTFEGQIHPLHLFLLIVGDSSTSRKSSALKRITRVVGPVFDAMHTPAPRLWWPSVSSPEGMIEELAREPNRLMLFSEWTDIQRLSSQSGYWKHNTEFFNTLYDAGDQHRARSKSSTVILRPRVSILGASTKSLVESSTTNYDWLAGKMARYLICCMRRPDDKEMEAEIDAPELVPGLQVQFGQILATLSQTAAAPRIEMTAEGWDIIRAWRNDPWWRDLQVQAPVHIRPSFARAQEHIFRVAALYEATVAPNPFRIQVSAESARAAVTLVEWCMSSMMQTFAVFQDEKWSSLQRVLVVLQTAGKAGIGRRDLLRRTHLHSKNMDEAISTLQQRGEVDQAQILTKKGLATTRYVYLTPDSDD